MRYSVALATAIAATANAIQVNFYWDRHCGQYADHRFPGPDQITGGPYGSQSALFVNLDGMPNCSQMMLICGDKDCKGAQRIVSIGECVGDLTAVYAQAMCII
ncbi:hypothetical protein NQ176_g3811 [Zarea fungicola]|uniref:Uncharacterized protein n=1 Tax=Zarea fungicola TaxID=93591 RepID=A0ACC1NIK7_9HYPO|nr:hypothetical protein NQ176_g3811 [Lecanicillium fungicola]